MIIKLHEIKSQLAGVLSKLEAAEAENDNLIFQNKIHHRQANELRQRIGQLEEETRRYRNLKTK